MSKAKPKTKSAGGKRRSTPKSRKPVDLHDVRQQIHDLVGGQAVDMVETTIGEADNWHYGAMKYLFEMIGLYPAAEDAAAPVGEDVLAKTLLKRLGLPEDPELTKDSAGDTAGRDTVE